MTLVRTRILGCCNSCGAALPVEGTSAELVSGVDTECPRCHTRHKVGWRHERKGDHGGVIQKRI